MEKNLGKLYLISTILILLTSAATAVELYYDNGPAGAENCMMIGPEGISSVIVRFSPNTWGTVETIRVLWTNQCSQTNATSPVDVRICECDSEGIDSCPYSPFVSFTNVVSGNFQDINVSSLNFTVNPYDDFCVELYPSLAGGNNIYIAWSGNATYLNRYYNYGLYEPEDWYSFSYIQSTYWPSIEELAVRAVISEPEEVCHWEVDECVGTCSAGGSCVMTSPEQCGCQITACHYDEELERCSGSCGSGSCVEVGEGQCSCYSTPTTTRPSRRGGGGGSGGGGSFGGGEASCYDSIKNCHDSEVGNTSQFLCEIDIDCGGPCDPCVSCSDGIQNQEETGVDCGGPCTACTTTTTQVATTIAESTTTTTQLATTTTTTLVAPAVTGFVIGSSIGEWGITLFLVFLLLIVVYIFKGKIMGGKK